MLRWRRSTQRFTFFSTTLSASFMPFSDSFYTLQLQFKSVLALP